MDVYLLCLILTLIPQRFRAFFSFFISLFAYLLAIVNAFCVEHFYAKIGPEILKVILETNSRESSEFIENYIGIDVLWSGVGVILVLIILHVFCAVCHYSIKLVISRKLVNCINCVFFLLLLVSFSFCLKSRIDVVRLMMASSLEEVDLLVTNYSQNTPFNNLLFSIKISNIENKGLDMLTSAQDSVEVKSCEFTSSTIVLIIGESYNKSHSQLYDYKKQTTPLQVSRLTMSEKGCLVPFWDVISPSNLTSIVFKNVLSLHSVDDEKEWTGAPLFPVIFRKAGYKVFFVTNQFIQALNTDIFNLSGGLFLNNNKLSKLQFDHRNVKTHQYDMDLIEDYDSLKRYKNEHNLFIFHLAGQHIDFYKRSPDVYKVFNKANYKDRIDLNDVEKQIVADYDNATYYNDVVLDSIISKFENDNALVLYMPDHGEECYDEAHRMGRVPADYYTPEVLRQEYRIPFWIWCSKKYIDTHQDIFNQIVDSRNKPFMTDDLPHLMLYLAGISCDYYIENRNIISPHFNVNRKRLINGKCDYDEFLRNH
jgi:heptose-I-phosphate ethanolaminephosphotransferase